jgi:hypothetical protein
MMSHGSFAIYSGLSPEEAMSEVVKQGGAVGVKRNGDPRLLKIWLDDHVPTLAVAGFLICSFLW